MKRSMVFEGVAVTLLILLLFLALAMIASGGTEREVSGIGNIQYTYAGSDNVLYAFSGNDIYAIDGNGNLKWTFGIPEQWRVSTNYILKSGSGIDGYDWIAAGTDPIASSDGDTLYVYLKPTKAGPSIYRMGGMLMAVSGGKELWELPLDSHKVNYGAQGIDDYAHQYSDVRLYAKNGRAYVFHDYNETVVTGNGTILWTIAGVTDPAAVDEEGFVYCVRSAGADGDATTSAGRAYLVYVPDYREPSGIIDAYYPNGTLYWENYPGNPLVRQSTKDDTLPLYHNGLIYAPMYNGIASLYTNGTLKWAKTYDTDSFQFPWPSAGEYAGAPAITGRFGLYSIMPFDSGQNVYVRYVSDASVPSGSGTSYYMMYLITIGPDGNELSRSYMPYSTYLAASDGIGYAPKGPPSPVAQPQSDYRPSNLTDLAPGGLAAFDVKSGKELGSYAFWTNGSTVVTLDGDNVKTLIGGSIADDAAKYQGSAHSGQGPRSIASRESLQVVPGNGVVYASFWSLNYESPVVPGQSRCAYVGGIYAFDPRGRLLWHKDAPPGIRQVAQNGTIFYRTPDGRIGITGAGVAAGFTLTAMFYLLLRFLFVGAVARAKSRLDKNHNRNRVYDFIADNPGSTISEISRGAGLNVGTVRYHAFVLGLNHKVVASHADAKYVRYFTNSNAYGKDGQLVFSLMRRDTIGRVLGLILDQPGISNVEIARALDIQESVACRYVKELSERGIVVRDPAGARGAYSIHETYAGPVADALKRLQGQ